MGEFNGEDRKKLQSIDVRLAVVETKQASDGLILGGLRRGVNFVLGILAVTLITAIMNLVLQ